MDPVKAGVEGTREIFFAVISTTITLAAVFMPVLFLGGLTGRLFREFGVTIAGAVLISAFVALTLTPMLCTRLLKHHGEKHNFIYDKTEPFFVWMIDAYRRSLAAFMPHRWMAIPILLVTFGLSWWLAMRTPSELAPLEDRSAFRVQATGPEGASYEYMDGYMQQLEELVIREVPEAEVTVVGDRLGRQQRRGQHRLRAGQAQAGRPARAQPDGDRRRPHPQAARADRRPRLRAAGSDHRPRPPQPAARVRDPGHHLREAAGVPAEIPRSGRPRIRPSR